MAYSIAVRDKSYYSSKRRVSVWSGQVTGFPSATNDNNPDAITKKTETET